MTPPTLLLGPAASGKTHLCLQRVRALLHAEPLAPVWVLLPDRHQAVTFRRHLVDEGGALGARVGTFGDLYTELLPLTDAPTPVAPEPVVHRLIRSAVTALAGLGQLQHYARIQDRPGLVQALSDLFAELKRARITPEQFKHAVEGTGRRLEELAELYHRYQSILIHFDWADPEGLGWLAIIQLQAHSDAAANWHFFIDGFDSFTLTQLETVDLLAARAASLTLTLTGEPDMARAAHRRFKTTLEALQKRLDLTIQTIPAQSSRPQPLAYIESALFTATTRIATDSRVHFIETQTLALEAREALRWLKARIVRDQVAVGECAIIARDLAPYAPFLNEAAREFGMALYLAGGEPLDRNPAIAAVINLIELPLNNWARRPLLDLLRTPYFDLSHFGFVPADAARLDNVARRGQVLAGLDQWREALDQLVEQPASIPEAEEDEWHPPPLPTGETALCLRRVVDALALRFTPPATASFKEYGTWLEEAVGELNLDSRVAAQADTAVRDEAALDVLRDILRALVLSDEIMGQAHAVAFEEFYAQLRGAIAAAAYLPDPAERWNAIYAANLNQARGVPYAAVVVLGLSEGLFPAPLTEDPFLSDDERENLKAHGLPLEKRLRNDQQSLFYEAVTRAGKYLLLTRPYLAEDGETWEPSPYWNAVLELFETKPERIRLGQTRSLADAASANEMLEGVMQRGDMPAAFLKFDAQWKMLKRVGSILAARMASEPQGPYEGELTDLAKTLIERYGADHVWSPSRLELYGICGFQFFIGAVLRLEPRQPPEPGFDPAQLGSILHCVLERVYQGADSHDVDALVAALPGVAKPIFDSASREFGFRPTPLWQVQQAELLAVLERTIRNLAEESVGWTPIQYEERFETLTLETSAGPVRVHGKIDRVDQNAAGEVRVIDYKTGSSRLDKKSLIDGHRLQLPLYAAGAEKP